MLWTALLAWLPRRGDWTVRRELEWDAAGVRLRRVSRRGRVTEQRLAWQDVLRVETYQLFGWTGVELVCLDLVREDGLFALDENLTGWRDFASALADHLDGFPDTLEWLDEVAYPPFATNHAVLWERAGGEPRYARCG